MHRLAIDFGTSNSLVATAEGKILALDEAAEDPTLFRTLLYFADEDTVYYGAQAVRQFVENDLQGRFIRSMKKFLPMRSFKGTYVGGRHLDLEELVAIFLRELRKRAADSEGREFDGLVLGRPARFSLEDDKDREAQARLERAALRAGFKEVEFLAEPLAAARAMGEDLKEERLIGVADLGGGTSDFTLCRMGGGSLEVLGLGGIPKAGDALDGCLMRKRISRHFGAGVKYQVPFGSNELTMPPSMIEKICSPADLSILTQRDFLEFLRNVKQWSLDERDRTRMDQLFTLIEDNLGFSVFEAIEACKRQVCEGGEGQFEFHYPTIDIQESFSNDQFERYTEGAVQAILASFDETCQGAGVEPGKIDELICTGGTARVPVLRKGLEARVPRVSDRRFFHSVIEGLAQKASTI